MFLIMSRVRFWSKYILFLFIHRCIHYIFFPRNGDLDITHKFVISALHNLVLVTYTVYIQNLYTII